MSEESGMTTLLPDEFADLEPFADWALDERGRALRQAAGQHHGRARRRSTTPRSPASSPRWPTSTRCELHELPEDASRLLWLCYSLVNVSFPVEVWRQPRVPDSGAASMDEVIEPAV